MSIENSHLRMLNVVAKKPELENLEEDPLLCSVGPQKFELGEDLSSVSVNVSQYPFSL